MLNGRKLKYLAIIGDIVDSKKIVKRAEVQRELEAALAVINSEYAQCIASDFLITLGDEFQGLLSNPEMALSIVNDLEGKIHGVAFRYGLGWGELATPLKPTSLGMDGPCFHTARESIIRAKEESRWISVEGFGDDLDVALNGIFRLIRSVSSRWKTAQRETVRLMRETGIQKEVARLRGVSTSVVSETLKAAQFRSVSEAEESITILMRRITKKAHGPDNS